LFKTEHVLLFVHCPVWGQDGALKHVGLRLGPSRISAYTSSEEFEDSHVEPQSKQQMKQPHAKQSISSRDGQQCTAKVSSG